MCVCWKGASSCFLCPPCSSAWLENTLPVTQNKPRWRYLLALLIPAERGGGSANSSACYPIVPVPGMAGGAVFVELTWSPESSLSLPLSVVLLVTACQSLPTWRLAWCNCLAQSANSRTVLSLRRRLSFCFQPAFIFSSSFCFLKPPLCCKSLSGSSHQRPAAPINYYRSLWLWHH